MINDRHDWSSSFIETLQWRTDVKRARDGESEERIALRSSPRRTVRTGMHVGVKKDGELHGSETQGQIKFLPGATKPTEAVAGDTLRLPQNADFYGFDAGDVAIVSADGTVQIEEATPTQTDLLIFDSAVTVTLGDVVYPLMNVRLAGPMELGVRSSFLRTAEAEWIQTDSTRWYGDEDDLTLTRDSNLETFEPVSGADDVEVFWREASDQGESLAVRVEQFDPGLGDIDFFDVDGIPRATIRKTIVLIGREEIWSMRRFLYRQRGRYGAFFVPAGHDLGFQEVAEDSGTNFWVVSDTGWVDTLPDARFAVVGHYADGTRSYHTIGDVADESHPSLPIGGGEYWLLNAYPAFGATAPVAVDWLVYSRLANDAHSIEWTSTDTASIDLEFYPLQFPSSWPGV